MLFLNFLSDICGSGAAEVDLESQFQCLNGSS